MRLEKDGSKAAIVVAVISAVATICAACIGGIFANVDRFVLVKIPTTVDVTQIPFSLPTQTHRPLPTNTLQPLPTSTPKPLPTSTPWEAGIEHPRHPHVIASTDEGSWEPEYGYRWKFPDDADDFQVVPIIENITVDHNVYVDGVKGMTIHVQFTVNDNYKDVSCRAVAYFYFSDPEKALISGDDNYTTEDGKVSVGRDFTPAYSMTTYEDLELFLPYNALNMSSEVTEADLKFRVTLYVESGKNIATSDWVYFTYTHK